MTRWTEQQIIAYLDGKLDMEEGRALHRDRQTDYELDAFIRSMDIDTAELAAALNEPATDAPQFDFEKPAAKMPMWKQSAIAASIALVFALGFLTSRFLPSANPPPGNWLQAVAEYQMLYSGQTLVLLEKTEDQRNREVANVARKLDISLKPENLKIDGLTYKRSQMLNYKNMPLVQFAWLDDNGNPIALCIIKRGKDKNEPISDKKFVAGQNGSVWYSGKYGYVVIGKADKGKIRDIANKLKARLTSL